MNLNTRHLFEFSQCAQFHFLDSGLLEKRDLLMVFLLFIDYGLEIFMEYTITLKIGQISHF